MAKSSIFAAIASHGCLPLLLPPKRCWAASPTSEDGLAIDRELITPASALHSRAGSASSPVAQAIATSAWQWYQSHRLSEQRRFIQDWLALSLDNTSPCGS